MAAVTFDQALDFTRVSEGTYIGADGLIKTAAVDEPRFTHDPENGKARGLLIEEQRTNYATSNHNLADYLRYAGAPDSGNTTRTTVPDSGLGTNIPGVELEAVASGGVGASREEILVSDSSPYALSAFFKPGTASSLTLDTTRTASGSFYARVSVDVLSGTVTTSGPGLGEGGARNIGHGWWYLWVYRVPGSGSGAGHVRVAAEGLLAGEKITVAAINAEQATSPSSYIPTEGTQVTRAAENCYRTFGEEFNGNEGSFSVTAAVPTGETVLAVGSVSIVSDSDAEKSYTASYSADPSATTLNIAPGASVATIKSITYEPRG